MSRERKKIVLASTGLEASSYLEALLDSELESDLRSELESLIESHPEELGSELDKLLELRAKFANLKELRSQEVEESYNKDFALNFLRESVKDFGTSRANIGMESANVVVSGSRGEAGSKKVSIPSFAGPKFFGRALAISGVSLGVFALSVVLPVEEKPISGKFASTTQIEPLEIQQARVQVEAFGENREFLGGSASKLDSQFVSGKAGLVSPGKSFAGPSDLNSMIVATEELPKLLGRTGNESKLLSSSDKRVLAKEFGGMSLPPEDSLESSSEPSAWDILTNSYASVTGSEGRTFKGNAAPVLSGSFRVGSLSRQGTRKDARLNSQEIRQRSFTSINSPSSIRGVRTKARLAPNRFQTPRPFAISWIESSGRYSFVAEGKDRDAEIEALEESLPVIWVHKR